VLKLHFAPRTRAVRILWLLEELGLPHELVRYDFVPTANSFFAQGTPTGKFPTLEDGALVMSESGAIVEYLLEKYGGGRLTPPSGTPERARFLQWLHFAESTAYPPLGIVVWLTVYRKDAEQHPEIVRDARSRARAGLEVVERALADGGPYLLGAEFSAADIMMGFTVAAAAALGCLDESLHGLKAYLARLAGRPAFQKAVSA
jgi:glutathione S-transferase